MKASELVKEIIEMCEEENDFYEENWDTLKIEDDGILMSCENEEEPGWSCAEFVERLVDAMEDGDFEVSRVVSEDEELVVYTYEVEDEEIEEKKEYIRNYALEKYQEYIDDSDVEDIIERWEMLYNGDDEDFEEAVNELIVEYIDVEDKDWDFTEDIDNVDESELIPLF